MTDDIDDDHTYMEVETLNKLKWQDYSINTHDEINENEWRLCFQEPKLNISAVNKLVGKMEQRRQELAQIEESRNDSNNRDGDVEDINTILEDIGDIDNDGENDDEYSEDPDQDDEDPDDDDDDALDEVILESEDDDGSVEDELQELLEISVVEENSDSEDSNSSTSSDE